MGYNMKQIKIMSFNLRVDVASDGINDWQHRKQNVIHFIHEHKPDMLALQEVSIHMLNDLKLQIFDYDFYITPRDEQGESVPLLIKKRIGNLIDTNTFWLSDTPTKVSKIEGSCFTRISTYAIIDIKDIGMIGIFNTHLDYCSDEISLMQAKYLLMFIEGLKSKYRFYTIILGDFNQNPQTKTIAHMRNIFYDGYDYQKNNLLTFHGFTNNQLGLPIDYIFYDKRLKFKQISIIYPNKTLSDHYPIELDIDLK